MVTITDWPCFISSGKTFLSTEIAEELNVNPKNKTKKKLSFASKIRVNKKNPLYVNFLDFENLHYVEDKLLPLSTVTLIYPSDGKPIPKIFRQEPQSWFPFHIVIVPESTRCHVQNRKISDFGPPMYDNTFYIDTFITEEER